MTLTLEHLMLELCKDEEVKSLFSFYKVDHKKIMINLEQFIENKLNDIVVHDEQYPVFQYLLLYEYHTLE